MDAYTTELRDIDGKTEAEKLQRLSMLIDQLHGSRGVRVKMPEGDELDAAVVALEDRIAAVLYGLGYVLEA